MLLPNLQRGFPEIWPRPVHGYMEGREAKHSSLKTVEPDLPTPITCKSGGFEKQAQKNLEIRTSETWRLQKYASIKNNDILFVSEYSLPN